MPPPLNAKRVYLAFPPNWDELSEEEKWEASGVIATAMQDALLTDEEKAEIGFGQETSPE